jgi:hypothetical protein
MGAITRGIANNILGNGAVDGTDALTGTIPATNISNPSLANLTTFPPSVDAGIPEVAGDPPAPSDGDVWYNTNTYKLKVRGLAAGTWASGNSMNTAARGGGSGGTETSAIAVGGYVASDTGKTELYDGTSWTEVNDLNQARRDLGVGAASNTAALAYGGEISPSSWYAITESWNGTSWTEVADLNAGRVSVIGAGIQTSALAIGGVASPPKTTVNESWNGTSWTEVGDLNTGKYGTGRAVGSNNTDALAVGNDALGSQTETWNGTSWTEVNDFNNGRSETGIGGNTSAALLFGGYTGATPNSANTEEWNGTSWIEVNDLNAGVAYEYSAGTGNSAAVSAGGYTGTANTANTEDWSKSIDNLNVDLA